MTTKKTTARKTTARKTTRKAQDTALPRDLVTVEWDDSEFRVDGELLPAIQAMIEGLASTPLAGMIGNVLARVESADSVEIARETIETAASCASPDVLANVRKASEFDAKYRDMWREYVKESVVTTIGEYKSPFDSDDREPRIGIQGLNVPRFNAKGQSAGGGKYLEMAFARLDFIAHAACWCGLLVAFDENPDNVLSQIKEALQAGCDELFAVKPPEPARQIRIVDGQPVVTE